MLNHKGYIGEVEFDDEAEIFHGEIINTRAVITFQGTTVQEVKKAQIESVEDYLEFCAKLGEEPERPSLGHFVLKLPPKVHQEITQVAKLENKSINNWICERLTEFTKVALSH